MNYASTNELREYLGQLPLTGDSSDVVLGGILARATGIIRSAIRNELRDMTFDFDAAPAASTRSILGYGAYLTLPPHVAGSVTTVLDTAGDLVAADDYTEHTHPPRYGDLRMVGDVWAEDSTALWAGRYTVTAQWGYGGVPTQMTQLCLEIATDIWRKKDAGFFPEIGVSGEGAIPVVTEWDRLGVISTFVEQYRREMRYE